MMYVISSGVKAITFETNERVCLYSGISRSIDIAGGPDLWFESKYMQISVIDNSIYVAIGKGKTSNDTDALDELESKLIKAGIKVIAKEYTNDEVREYER